MDELVAVAHRLGVVPKYRRKRDIALQLLRGCRKITFTFPLGLLTAGFVARSLQITADMRLARVSQAVTILARKSKCYFAATPS